MKLKENSNMKIAIKVKEIYNQIEIRILEHQLEMNYLILQYKLIIYKN
jgi:hypothetical protein